MEIVFSDSTKGLLQYAKKYCTFDDAVCIGFCLDIGDIHNTDYEKGRKQVFDKLWKRYNFSKQEKSDFFSMLNIDHEKLINASKAHVPIRIWVSRYSPYSLCGLYFVCDILKNSNSPISVVFLPEYIQKSSGTIIQYTNWNEIEPKELLSFLKYEKVLSPSEKRLFRSLWCELKQENAPLRAIISGKLISVSENFYDSIIIKNIPDSDFLMAKLIGDTIGKYKLGISDGFIAYRIDCLIKDGFLKLVKNKDKSRPYAKILRKTT